MSFSQSVLHKPATQHLNFLLAPPPPPRSKSPRPQPQPPTPPITRSTRVTPTCTPRSPLSPRESFLNILDTPSPPGTLDRKGPSHTQQQLLDASRLLLSELGYNITINTFYAAPSSPVTPRPTSKENNKSRSKSVSTTKTTMNILTRDRSTSSAAKQQHASSSSNKMPLHSRSNHSGGSPPTIAPRPQATEPTRRGSVPNIPTSSSQNYPLQPHHHHSKQPSSSSSSTQNGQAIRKRYPLPLPYSSVVEMDQILGDMRSAQNVSSYMAASTLATGGGAYTRGATVLPAVPTSPGVVKVGSGAPWVGSDGRLWRDREEEMEYKGLLASSPKSISSHHQHYHQAMEVPELRRGSAETDESIEAEEEDRLGRRQWAKFGRHHHHHSRSAQDSSRLAVPAPAPGHPHSHSTTVYDSFKVSEQRLRLPSSATSSSGTDDDDGEVEPWSPLIETHTAQHQFPAYIFPGSSSSSGSGSGSKSSRRSGNTTLSSGTSGNGSTSSKTSRVLPLPVSMADFTVRDRDRDSGVAIHVHPPKAKDEFLASSFVPVPSSRSGASSKPPTGASRESRRASVQGYPTAARRRDEVPSKSANTTIDIPLPSIAPHSQGYHLSPPSRSSSRPGSSNGEKEKEKKGGFLGVFKKSSK